MTANALEPTYTELRRHLAREAGWPPDPSDWGSERTTQGADVLESAISQFYWPEPIDGSAPHEWSFLSILAELDLNASYSTGTVAIAADGSGSIVTLTGGTWPSWAAQGDLWVSGERYTVLSRTSNTVLRLDNVAVTVASGTSYALHQHYYDLPDDFGSIPLNAFTYRRDQSSKPSKISIVNELVIRQLDRSSITNAWPKYAAIVPISTTQTTQSTRYRVMFWPLTTSARTVEYRYKAIPPALSTTHVYYYGGAPHRMTVEASITDMVWQRLRKSEEKHPAFLAQLARSIRYDRARMGVETLGMGSKSLAPSDPDLSALLREHRSGVSSANITLSFGEV